MTWAHPVVLALIPMALVGAWWIFRRSAGVSPLPSFDKIARLWAGRNGLSATPRSVRRRLRGLCFALGCAAAFLAVARPQWGTVEERTFDQSREVLLALDLSRSMLADDVSPNRLARAKLLIEGLLDQLHGERVGLVVFAGTAFVQSPLSADYEVLREFLAELDPSYLPQAGTDYSALLTTATKAFGETGDGDRFLVVLSDGEAHDPEWKSQIPALRDGGIRVIGLGVGTAQGALMPDARTGVIKDENGAAVLSRLEPATLQELAAATNGTYRDAAAWVDIAALVNETVERGRKGRYVEQTQVRLQDRYQWFLAPALCLLLLAYWLELPVFPSARIVERRRVLRPATAQVAVLALLLSSLWLVPQRASAATTTPAGQSPFPPSGAVPNIEATVAELSDKADLGAGDYARLATETVGYASQTQSADTGVRTAVIDDALAAVNRGESLDAQAADWPTLRQELEQLRAATQQPPPDSQQQTQPENNQAEQDGGEGANENQQDAQGGNQNGAPNQQDGGTPQQEKQSPSESSNREPSGAPQDSQQSGAAGDKGAAPQEPSQQDAANQNGSAGDAAAKQAEGQDPAEAPEHGGSAAGSPEQKADETHAGADDKAGDRPAGAEGQEPKPLNDAVANVGPLAVEQAAEPKAVPPQSETAPRRIGGGRVVGSADESGDPVMGAIAGKMDRIREGDAPAVLFDRMNRAEGAPPAQQTGKPW